MPTLDRMPTVHRTPHTAQQHGCLALVVCCTLAVFAMLSAATYRASCLPLTCTRKCLLLTCTSTLLTLSPPSDPSLAPSLRRQLLEEDKWDVVVAPADCGRPTRDAHAPCVSSPNLRHRARSSDDVCYGP
jgi:hypothetical protein